jgi:hypothetical protein
MVLIGIGNAMAQTDDLLKVNPVPSLQHNKQEGVKGTAFIDEIDGMGIIRRIDNDFIVIEDMIYKLSNNVRYFGIDGFETFRSKFTEGHSAAFVLNADHEIESLWEVKKRK